MFSQLTGRTPHVPGGDHRCGLTLVSRNGRTGTLPPQTSVGRSQGSHPGRLCPHHHSDPEMRDRGWVAAGSCMEPAAGSSGGPAWTQELSRSGDPEAHGRRRASWSHGQVSPDASLAHWLRLGLEGGDLAPRHPQALPPRRGVSERPLGSATLQLECSRRPEARLPPAHTRARPECIRPAVPAQRPTEPPGLPF